MTIEERLRRTLEHRAESATPSPDAWAAITERVETRSRSWLVPALALGTATALIAGVVAFVGGGDGNEIVAGPGEGSGPAAGSTATAAFPGIWPAWDWEGWADLEQRIGDDPSLAWHFDPLATARAYLDERGFAVDDEGFSEVDPGSDTDCETARFDTGRADQVELAYVTMCPLGDSKAYAVMAAGTDRLSVPPPAFGDHVELSVTVAEPGLVTARAGAFASEWIDQYEARAETRATETLPMTLDVGDPPLSPLLVQVVHESAVDGSAALVEFRLDRASIAPADVNHEACRNLDVPAEHFDGPDLALHDWMRGEFETPNLVEDPDRGAVESRATNYLVIGDVAREARRAKICVRTHWGWYPDARPGERPDERTEYLGYTEDVVTVERAGAEWMVTRVERSALRDPGAVEVASVLVWLPDRDVVCGEPDAPAELLGAALVLPGESGPETALRQLVTGGPWPAGWNSSLPPQARVNSVAVDDQGVAHADFSDAIRHYNESCRGLAKVAQIRRTLLAQDGVTGVRITVDGEEAELIG